MTERDWIARYIRPLVTAPGAANLRDDVAVLSNAGVMIATMDTLVEGVHFLDSDPIGTVGQKLLRVNVSDILAKAALPHEALLSISWPDGRAESAFADLIAGLKLDLDTFGVSLIGGDFVRTTGPFSLTLTLTGRCISDGPVRRGGGRVGDRLVVSGEIGWGLVGLEAAREGKDDRAADRYRVPQLADSSAAMIAAKRATASMDVSDGLLIDAAQLADASGCGARIDLERVPLAMPTESLDDILAQCSAGDDYQILMAIGEGGIPDGFTCIGELIQNAGLSLRYEDQPVNLPVTLGFEH